MDKILKNLSAEIAFDRMLIPIQNRKKFDIEAARIFNAIKNHGKNDSHVCRLLERWGERKYYLRHIANCYFAPAALIREPGESGEEYLKRCFDAAERSW